MKKIGKICLFWAVVAALIEPCYAYIDPATGSMLFSVFLGAATTLFFLIQTLYNKLALFLNISKINHNNHPIVIYSEGRKYKKVFSPILDEFEKRKIPITFYTSSEDDFCFSRDYKYIQKEYIGKGNKAYFRLAFLNCDICLMTTPGLDVFQLKRSKYTKHYTFISHGIGDMCDYRMFSLDYFDSLFLVSDINKKYVRQIEQKRNLKKKELVVVGAPSLDYMQEELKNYKIEQKNDKFTILFAPSWGVNSIASQLGEKILDKLRENNNYQVIIRFHPQSFLVELDMIKKYKKRYKDVSHFCFDEETDNLKSMAKSDLMISDFSAIIREYAYLFKKPVLYSCFNYNPEVYDSYLLDEVTWRFDKNYSIGKELTQDNIEHIIDIIEDIKNTPKDIMTEKIEKIKNLTWQNQGKAKESIADFLIQKQKEL